MSSIGAARAAVPLSPARAEASRRNGAKSRGPITPEGKARAAQNALKHGLRAQKYVVLPRESTTAFEALEAALIEELVPEGALQTALAQRIVCATWRLARAERLEAELFTENELAGRSLGLALIRDCNGARSFDTLLRYRGGALAELWRALRTLKALQAEQADGVRAMDERQPDLLPKHAGAPREAVTRPAAPALSENPSKPKTRGNPGESPCEPDPTAPPLPDPTAAPADAAPVSGAQSHEPNAHDHAPGCCKVAPPEPPIEPEARGNAGRIAPAPAADAGAHGDLGAEAAQQRVGHAPLVRHSRAVHGSAPTNGARSKAGAGGRT